MSANKIILQSGVNIGQNGAEGDDLFLFKCFVDHPCFSEISDIEVPASFILGSTGAGKTAILRMIQYQKENVSEVAVHDLSINHLSSSDTILFLKQLDVDLTLLFQSLWKHILCVEYIKLALNAPRREQFAFKFKMLVDRLSKGGPREKLERFVKNYEGHFWNTMDENVVELTDEITKNFNVEFGGEVRKFSSKAGYVHTLGAQQKIHLQQRAKQFIQRSIITELPQVISSLSEYTKGRFDNYYLIIDGLDENWVEDEVKFQLIQALFETTKGLRKLRNFQLAISLRNDLYFRMIEEAVSSKAQIEKYEDLIVRIKWTKSQLRLLAEKRIRELFKRKYSSESVEFEDIFKQKPDSRSSPWDYIVERTLYRPRDVINFVNLALQAAEGKSAVSKNDFLTGEADYSNLRYETLVHEWSGTFPAIRALIEKLRSRTAHGLASEYLESKLIEDLYDYIGKDSEMQKDSIWKKIDDYVSSNSRNLEAIDLVQPMFYRLHLIGAVGLKLRADTPWNWVHETQKPISLHQIDGGTRFKIHPMLYASLGIRK